MILIVTLILLVNVLVTTQYILMKLVNIRNRCFGYQLLCVNSRRKSTLLNMSVYGCNSFQNRIPLSIKGITSHCNLTTHYVYKVNFHKKIIVFILIVFIFPRKCFECIIRFSYMVIILEIHKCLSIYIYTVLQYTKSLCSLKKVVTSYNQNLGILMSICSLEFLPRVYHINIYKFILCYHDSLIFLSSFYPPYLLPNISE